MRVRREGPGRDPAAEREVAAPTARAGATTRLGRSPSRPDDPRHRHPDRLLALQRSVGNAVVARMVRPVEDDSVRADSEGSKDSEDSIRGGAVRDVLRSSGSPLAEPVRQEMEARLGADFSTVRLHTDSAAAHSARQIGARAYTSGDHVVVGDGGADRHTLAHELTHVIQQRTGPVTGTDHGDGLRMSDPTDRFERQAEATAARALSGDVPEESEEPDSTVQTAHGPPVQRSIWHGHPDAPR